MRVLSQHKLGSRALAILHDCDSGVSFIAFIFFETTGAMIRAGHCYALRHGEKGLDDIIALVAEAKRAPR